MGKLSSPNIAAQVDLFLGVLPAFLGVLLIGHGTAGHVVRYASAWLKHSFCVVEAFVFRELLESLGHLHCSNVAR